jgi:O-antigen ligase
MTRTNEEPPSDTAWTPSAALGTFLFMVISLFLWISVTPFVDLTGEAVLDPAAGRSNLINQIVTIVMSACLLGYGLAHPMRNAILQPRVLMGVMFIWFLAVSIISAHPTLGVRGIAITVLMMANAAIYLLLPSSERHFAKMIGITMLIMLALAYYGILFKPTFSIHQAAELREPMNAGLWRGHFPHKNSAAAAMVLATFFGLYVMNVWSRPAGIVICVLSFLFLMNTGGKTSTAMLPAIILVAFVFEKIRWLRIPIAIGGVVAFNVIAVGAAVYLPLGEFIAGLGIDATFTNRSDIWRLAFGALAEQPLTGYGFRGFWQTEQLVHSGGTVETWAVTAANGHNAFLDIALMTGIPGLLLALYWLLLLPLRDFARMGPAEEQSHLTRLFVRIWLYALFNAGLESIFFEGGSFIWFTLVMALCGLRLQSRATLAGQALQGTPARGVAHA